jgi:hypothetical protein
MPLPFISSSNGKPLAAVLIDGKKNGWIQYPLKLHEYFHSMADTAF